VPFPLVFDIVAIIVQGWYGLCPRTRARARARGAWFLFLPPYSPDLNPIEMAFSKLKAHLRRIGARIINELWLAVGNNCDLYAPDECKNDFKAAGYTYD